MTDTIFRVEHETDGAGCYYKRYGMSNFLDAMHEAHSADVEGHPNPQNDVGIDRCIGEKEFCGFKSMESLCQWFMDDEISKLYKIGFPVIELNDVKITAIGEKQVLFIKNAEKILKKEKILLDKGF